MSRENKLLINAIDNCVDEMLEGIVLENPGLQLLENHRVILREDLFDYRKSKKVSIICGGGSGHEPFAAGFVGSGMLTAAVAGSVFASPPPNDILAAIRAVSSPAGVLLIVANYTGDRLNFGIALERARVAGHHVEMVVVGEDCALESQDKTAGRRGLVGIVNIMKIAGALAEEGKTLEDILLAVEEASTNMGTIGMSLSGCSIPGSGSSFKLKDNEMELGLGAHGEAGVKRLELLSADDTVNVMFQHITNPKHTTKLDLAPGSSVAVTINNLGGMSILEMHVITRKVILLLESHGVTVDRFYFGHFMTSLDMAGFNLNILKLNDVILKCLDADTTAPGWPRCCPSFITGNKRVTKPKLRLAEVKLSTNNANEEAHADCVSNVILSIIEKACQALISAEALLNDLDTSAGDGDCGTTLKRGASDVLKSFGNWSNLTASQVFLNLSSCAERSMGGASGGLYSLFFTAASKNITQTTLKALTECLDAGMNAVSRYGGAEPGDRTLLDALFAASNTLKQHGSSNDISMVASAVAVETKKAAEATANMKAKAGRASYVASNLVTQPDPGATAVAIIFDTISKCLNKMNTTQKVL